MRTSLTPTNRISPISCDASESCLETAIQEVYRAVQLRKNAWREKGDPKDGKFWRARAELRILKAEMERRREKLDLFRSEL